MGRRTFFDYFGVEYYADNLSKVRTKKEGAQKTERSPNIRPEKPPKIKTARKNAHIEIEGWEDIRLPILARDRYQCQICGIDNGLTVHHKNMDRTINTDDNLITLCWDCHKKVHNKKIVCA